jgi:hypothetical protein
MPKCLTAIYISNKYKLNERALNDIINRSIPWTKKNPTSAFSPTQSAYAKPISL